MEKSRKKRKSWQETSLGEYLQEMEDEMITALGGQEPVARHWDAIVGDEMKDHVTLESVDETSLVVKCDHPAYSSYFRLHEREVLQRLARQFPTFRIRKVRIIS